MKRFYLSFFILFLLIQSQNSVAQCGTAKFTKQIIDTTQRIVAFTNTTTYNYTHYSWSFGDGQFSTLKNPSPHTYAKSGKYYLELKGTDSIKNCYDTAGMWISVGCWGEPVFSSNENKLYYYTSKPGAFKLRFDFGDGTSSTRDSGNHVYSSLGTYNVCLIVYCETNDSSEKNCQLLTLKPNCVAAFDIPNKDSVNKTKFSFINRTNYFSSMKFKWNLGDGRFTESYNALEYLYTPGTYTICLRVEDTLKKCTDSICHTITVGSAPVPCKAKYIKTYDETQKFKLFLINNSTNSSSTTYLWNFGDGATSTSRNPTHKYNFGKFTVCLKVTDASCSSEFCDIIGMDSTGKLLKAGSFDIEVIEGSFTGTGKIPEPDFIIYPNPANNKVSIDMTQSSMHYEKLEVLNSNGSVCIMQKIENGNKIIELDLQKMAQGLYFIKLSNYQGYSYRKLIKN